MNGLNDARMAKHFRNVERFEGRGIPAKIHAPAPALAQETGGQSGLHVGCRLLFLRPHFRQDVLRQESKHPEGQS